MSRRKNSVRRNVVRNHLGNASAEVERAIRAATTKRGVMQRGVDPYVKVVAESIMFRLSLAMDKLDEADGGGCPF